MKTLSIPFIMLVLGLAACTNCAPTEAKPAQASRHEQPPWEYKLLRAEGIGESETKRRAKMFNDLAAEGWEYTGSIQPGGGSAESEMVFRRARPRP